jgi:hypothetical protein
MPDPAKRVEQDVDTFLLDQLAGYMTVGVALRNASMAAFSLSEASRLLSGNALRLPTSARPARGAFATPTSTPRHPSTRERAPDLATTLM